MLILLDFEMVYWFTPKHNNIAKIYIIKGERGKGGKGGKALT